MVAGGQGEEDFQAENDDRLTLYPVPVDAALFVKMDGETGRNTVVTIVNVHGLTVYKDWYAVSQSIDTQLFKSGVYFLQISDDDGFRRVIKFIKQ